jgi:hypothetical protein
MNGLFTKSSKVAALATATLSLLGCGGATAKSNVEARAEESARCPKSASAADARVFSAQQSDQLAQLLQDLSLKGWSACSFESARIEENGKGDWAVVLTVTRGDATLEALYLSNRGETMVSVRARDEGAKQQAFKDLGAAPEQAGDSGSREASMWWCSRISWWSSSAWWCPWDGWWSFTRENRYGGDSFIWRRDVWYNKDVYCGYPDSGPKQTNYCGRPW